MTTKRIDRGKNAFVNLISQMRADSASLSPLGLRDKEASRLRCYMLLAASDAIAIIIAFVSANAIISLAAPHPIEHGFVMLGVILPLYAIQSGTNGTYGAATLEDASLGAKRASGALLIAGAVVLLIAYMLKASDEFSRGVFAIGFVTSLGLILVARKLLQPRILRLLSGSAHNIVVVRDSIPYEAQGQEVVLDASALGFDPLTKDPRAYHALSHAIARADRMVVACRSERAAAWAPVLRSLAVDGEILTDVQDEVGAIGMRRLCGHNTLIINYGPMTLSARMTKRLFDILFSSFALLILAPVLVGTAIAIRWETPGPIFFRQERIGRGNRIFRIYKFRSMFAHAADEHAATLTKPGDQRITKVGRFIRRTSIDELPQLINVLQGDMSVVGPRPHALAAKAANLLYWDADTRYRQRHVIKPGMTGLAQVRGFRGNTHQVQDLTDRLQADLEYVATWSLRHDISIILQTLKVMSHGNAY